MAIIGSIGINFFDHIIISKDIFWICEFEPIRGEGLNFKHFAVAAHSKKVSFAFISFSEKVEIVLEIPVASLLFLKL